jgi:hypothetical protein
MMHMNQPVRTLVRDADPIAFLVSQTASIEAGVDPVDHADIQYPDLMTVDMTANDWASNVTYFSMDQTGEAKWFAGDAQDMPFAESTKAKHEVQIHLAAIGYEYSLEELMQAQMVPGASLSSERASAAREAANRFVERVAKTGDTTKGWRGLYNQTGVTSANSTARWVTPTGGIGAATVDQIIGDVNGALSGVYDDTEISYMADTLLLPPRVYAFLAGYPRASGSDQSIIDWLKVSNVFTSSTNQALMIKSGIGLDTVVTGGRMIAYKNDPKVIRLHYPMMHQFLDPREMGAGISYAVPGIMRLGGVEVKRSRAIRYVDNLIG